ncbi:S41 family peptidase [Bacillus infantis]|uniref:Tail specific protease domain-containing protein n=1 Tax=Bacillus infantis TaxID=324767 RepID=A0A5D4RIB7_9BACI|nr:S41 family peptidase [Bacillus infantis]TYS51047.1 hypothetical protein FZD51_03110 [Bacillus infantis]
MNKKSLFSIIALIAIVALIAGSVFLQKENENEVVIKEVSEERVLNNASSFAKIYGYIRFYHPSDENEKVDWDKFAVYGLEKVKSSKNDKDLIQNLNELFIPIAPTIEISNKPSPLKAPYNKINLKEPELNMVFWQHSGLGTAYAKQQGSYKSQRIITPIDITSKNNNNLLFEEKPPPGEIKTYPITEDVYLHMPISLYYQHNKTLGATSETSKEFQKRLKAINNTPINDVEDSEVKMAAITVYWNVIQHFYPYHLESELNWSNELEAMLKRSEDEEITNVLKETTVLLKDGHANIINQNKNNGWFSRLPFQIERIDNRFFVANLDEEAPVKLGDELLSIDGVDAQTFFENECKFISGSHQYQEYRALETMISGKENQVAELVVKREGEKLNLEAIYANKAKTLVPPFKELEQGVYYINLTGDFKTYLDQNMNKLMNAKAIIFDVRGYITRIQDAVTLISYLTKETITGPKYKIPTTIYPNQEGITFDDVSWKIEPNKTYLEGKKYILVDPSALSASESFLGMMEDNQLAEFIGQPSAGVNGDINQVSLPGGLLFQFTGLKTVKKDGSQHHLIGIEPNYPISKTIEDVLSGEDKYISKALELIN